MNKFNLYDLIGKLAAATTQKKEENPAADQTVRKDRPAPPPPVADIPPKKPFGADKAAVVEMLRRHDKKSREIDEKIKKAAQSAGDEYSTEKSVFR